MTIQEPLIRDFMTLQPQTIQGKESVETAAAMMSKSGIRHLPVMKDGTLAGILSEREVNLASGMESIDPKQVLVIDVCSEKPYIVLPETPLREVVDTMAKRHLGSAIVMEYGKLLGIFTTVDACRALHDLLEDTFHSMSLESIRSFRLFLKPFGNGAEIE